MKVQFKTAGRTLSRVGHKVVAKCYKFSSVYKLLLLFYRVTDVATKFAEASPDAYKRGIDETILNQPQQQHRVHISRERIVW